MEHYESPMAPKPYWLMKEEGMVVQSQYTHHAGPQHTAPVGHSPLHYHHAAAPFKHTFPFDSAIDSMLWAQSRQVAAGDELESDRYLIQGEKPSSISSTV